MISGRDTTQQWFRESRPTKSAKSRNILAAGTYSGQLTKVQPGVGKSYNGEPPRNTLTFFFELDCGEAVIKTVTASANLKSQCMALVSDLSEDKPLSLAAMTKPDQLQAHILGLIGSTYRLEIGPSGCGRYNNIMKVGSPLTHEGANAV